MKEKMILKMIDFYQGNTHDIEHFLKVHAYAALIGKEEGLPVEMQETLEMAAIVHDISCPLCREKYGKAFGSRQEEESEALLILFLEEFGLPAEVEERIIYLVSHHHTYTGVDGKDYQILLEADYLVNASEGGDDPETIRKFYENVFRTDCGKRLMKSIYKI